MQVIYIAPLKAIVRERMNDWRKHLVSQLGKQMVRTFIHLLYTYTIYQSMKPQKILHLKNILSVGDLIRDMLICYYYAQTEIFSKMISITCNYK